LGTLRRVRKSGHAGIQLAIVSANALTRGWTTTSAYAPEDFILAVRHNQS
jgi:hypothetical protein